MDIHGFQFNGSRYIFDVSSSACFSVDELMCDVLDLSSRLNDIERTRILAKSYGKDEVDEAFAELVLMKEQGFFSDKVEADHFLSRTVVSLGLNVSHACNLNCLYCYAEGGSYGLEAEVMDRQVAFSAIDLLTELSRDKNGCSITFFGGEPLTNFGLIRQTVEYAKKQAARAQKRVHFSITTNGTLITREIAQFLRDEDFNIWLSIDGPKDIQDSMRPKKNGEGSHSSVLVGIDWLRNAGISRLNARATISRQNKDIFNILTHMESIGITNAACIPVSIGESSMLALTDDDIIALCKQYDSLADKQIEAARDRRPFICNNFRKTLEALHLGRKYVYSCGVGKRMMTVVPSGDIYPCHRFVGLDAFKMGHVASGLDSAVRELFYSQTVTKRALCSACWARYICGGGCLNDVADEGGAFCEPNELNCDLNRRLIEAAIHVYANLDMLGLFEKERIEHSIEASQC